MAAGRSSQGAQRGQEPFAKTPVPKASRSEELIMLSRSSGPGSVILQNFGPGAAPAQGPRDPGLNALKSSAKANAGECIIRAVNGNK